MLEPLVCAGCGQLLTPNRPDQKYHGAPCRLLAHRRLKRGETTPERTTRAPRLVNAVQLALTAEPAPRFGSLWTLLLGAMTLEQPLTAWRARDPQGYARAREQAQTITPNPALVYAAAVELGFGAAVEAHVDEVPRVQEAHGELAIVEALHVEEVPHATAVEAHVEEEPRVQVHGERRAKKKTARTASDIEGLRTGLQKAITQHGSQHALAQALSWSQSTISKFLGGKPLSQEKREDLAAFLNEKHL